MIRIKCQTGDDVSVDAQSLVDSNLSNLNLHRALLEDADLRRARLIGTNLRSAWIERSDFTDCDMRRALLFSVRGSGARFVHTNLQGAVLSGGVFDGADFSGADMQEALLSLASFMNATFFGANLRKARRLETAQFQGAKANRATTWPDGFIASAHGVVITG